MKVVSFFSAKGGTCKTTMNMLFASFLKYHLGKRVIVLDFDSPEFNLSNTRKRELLFAQDKDMPLDVHSLYPIHEVDEESARNTKDILEFIEDVRPAMDFLVLDFGGSFVPSDIVCRLVMQHAIDLMVIPVEMDGMIIASAKALAWTLQEMGQQTLLFFNKVHGREKPQLYDALEDWFKGKGVNISPNRVKNALNVRRDSDNGSNFVRSSVVFPLKDIRANNPGILNLFEEVAGHDEMEKTEKTA